MNLWSYISGANAEPADDRAVLVKAVDSDSANGANVDGRNYDNEKEHDADKHTADDSAECERCERDRLVESEDSKGLECSSSVEVTEVYVEEEQAKNKRRKKPLRKRVRKRVWRVVRTSWKYLRRGMAGYSPALSSMFLWGVNLSQPVPTAKTSPRYF